MKVFDAAVLIFGVAVLADLAEAKKFSVVLTPDGCEPEVFGPFLADPCGPFGNNRTLSKPPYLMGEVDTPEEAVYTLCCLMKVCIPELISGMLCQNNPASRVQQFMQGNYNKCSMCSN
uniref:Saposin B-type domain-containing protein n=1 Tax=Steinernema glaseri TaxID=37863 RepID=A0A1I7Y6T4_9BILA